MTINEVLEALTPENARFVSGQNLYLYVPKAQTNKRYGLAKYSPDDFSIDSNGVLSLLLPKSQIEDYFDEIRGGTREETVIANPKINLLNLDAMDKELQNSIDDLYDKDKEIYGSGGRENTVLKGIDLTKLNERDNTLQDNIDYIIQDDRDDTATDSTYSANKITKLIHEAKLEGLHFVGFVGEEVGKDHEGEAITPKDGILWHVSDEASVPSINKQWSADTMFIYSDGNWVPYGEDYIPEDFAIWKNVNLPDSEINSWWWFETAFEVLDFNVDMSLYYTKVESDARYKPMFTYGTYLSEVDKVLTIDNLVMPTTGKLTSFVQGTDSVLDVDNVEDAIKLLEKNTKDEIDIINARPFWLPFNETPTRLGEYSVTTNGVYRSVVNEEGGFKWQLVTDDLDTLLPRANANVNVADGLSFTNDEETGYFLSKLSLINLNTEEKTSTPISVPVATNHTDGIMPATAMQALEELDIKVTALQSGVQAYFVDFGSDTPSQTALDLLYKTASGESGDIPNLTRLIDAERNIYYEYYTSLDPHWQGPYVYRYGVASLAQIGLVKSSEQKGQIFVEPVSGVMSLNGYTDIINTFNTLYGGEGRTQIDVNQVPSLPASKITSGTLNSARLPVVPVSKGGTNNSSFSAYKLVVTGSVDETDNTANSLNDGPAFGSVDTILAGNGANQIPSFKSKSALDLQLVSNKVTTTLSASNTDVQYPSAKLVFTELTTLSNTLTSKIDIEISDRKSAINTEASTRENADTTLTNTLNNVLNNSTRIANAFGGGFSGGQNSLVAGVNLASGAAIGRDSWVYGGGVAGGRYAHVYNDSTLNQSGGAALGESSTVVGAGGAVGNNARNGAGFSGGFDARVKDDGEIGTHYIDAIQLGTGLNETSKSLQIYDDNIYNASTHTLTVNNIADANGNNAISTSQIANRSGRYSTLKSGGNVIVDTRDVNSPPSYYANQATCYEFKTANVLGLGMYMPNDSFVTLKSVKGWTGSNYIVYQEAVSAGNNPNVVNNGVKCYRYGVEDTWGEWQIVGTFLPYEFNKELSFGASGYLYIGKFPIYDTNITVDISCTTSTTYSGKLVIACQNHVVLKASVFGDYSNTVTPNIHYKVVDNTVEIYFTPQAWSKNLIHITGCGIQGAVTHVCEKISAIPSDATSQPENEFGEAGSNSNGYYVKYGDGVLLCWGTKSISSNNQSNIVLPYPFKDTNYVGNANGTRANYGNEAFIPISTSTYKILGETNSNPFRWQAIGYWK